MLSIGYSACHWCHVMEHQSFEDSLIAEYMNKYFYSIKVDREERPDVDELYMRSVNLLTGGGGWPLNVFALPDGRAFHGGTYFAKENWLKVLKAIQKEFDQNNEKLVQKNIASSFFGGEELVWSTACPVGEGSALHRRSGEEGEGLLVDQVIGDGSSARALPENHY